MRWQLLILAVAACSASTEGSTEPPRVDAAPPGTGGSPDYVRYRGTLATTASMAFGGDPYCNYSVALKSVEIDLVLRTTDELSAMAIEDTMTESIVGTCPYEPSPPNRQQFTHDNGRAVPVNGDGKAEPLLSGIASNQPMTAATAVVTVARDGLVQATARWERTDQGPPLKWIISTPSPVMLQRSTCTPGGSICVGGSLYSCVDGMQMLATSICTAGCAASKTACN